MRIVADENIPYVAEAFGHLGSVRTVPGRKLARPDLADADVLLVRSVTPVSAELLADTPVRFVGTATIGTDHVDTAYLARRGIAFASAAGGNANSVAEYVIAALLNLYEGLGLRLQGRTLGVIGCGNVGGLVLRYTSQALSMRVLVNDPPLQRQTGRTDFVSLDQVLAESDAISLHVPLTRTGADKTFHLIGPEQIARMRPDAILLNTSRGAVVDNPALKDALEARRLRAAVLDVWQGEPNIDARLLELVALGTPHIAGYSFDGKVAGTRMLFDAVCRRFNVPDAYVDWTTLVPAVPDPDILLQPTGDDQKDLHSAVQAVYSIAADDARLRPLSDLPADQRGATFDRLRRQYPVRREFHNYGVRLQQPSWSLPARLAAVGFRMGRTP